MSDENPPNLPRLLLSPVGVLLLILTGPIGAVVFLAIWWGKRSAAGKEPAQPAAPSLFLAFPVAVLLVIVAMVGLTFV